MIFYSGKIFILAQKLLSCSKKKRIVARKKNGLFLYQQKIP